MATIANVGYRIDLRKPDDSQVNRDRFSRWLSLIACTIIMYAGPTGILWYWGSLIGYPFIGSLVGFGVGGYIASIIIPDRFLINNQEWTAYVTQSMFNGKMVTYGPGLHPSHWWEERSKIGNYPLDVMTRSFVTSIATATSRIMIHTEYEYAISLHSVSLAIGIDESTIEGGLVGFIQSFLTSKCATRSAEWARTNVETLNGALASEFMSTEVNRWKPGNLERRYGFVTVSIVVSAVTLAEGVQNALDAIDEARTDRRIVAELYGITVEELNAKMASKEISQEDFNKSLDRAMTMSKEATMNVSVIEGGAAAVLVEGGTKS
ncbi:MAG TPA: hypothetical protein VMV62_00945 [Candidatus Paceibacterota bacterium]|nr:hypothetical protein [Candidatus Paceibacterota bacterium]